MKVKTEEDIQDDAEDGEDGEPHAVAICPRNEAPFPPQAAPFPRRGARDCNADGIYPGDGDGVVQFDVVVLLHVDAVGLEYRITTEDEGVPTVDVDTVVAMVERWAVALRF